ncbi:MAG: hypothetical protein GY913_08175 [Proteobacteria bacterium]|nr:hypothetical protein [Pseudomonadota bacterium]MCP4916888.1 hypothetical protein [Pseudomonadota bacterium]
MLWTLLACATTLPDPLPNEPRMVYEFAHERWTRDLHIVSQFETQVVVKATLVTDELAEAQALTISRARFEDAETYQQRYRRGQDEADTYWTVVFVANAPPPHRADSFALDDSADWQIHLEADGRRLDPVDLERIWEPSADQEMMYTQHDRWSKMWKARFDRPTDADEVEMLVVGPYGNGKITWQTR